MEKKSAWKSKTLVFNVVIPAIYTICIQLGLQIPEEVLSGVLAIGNFILRFLTKEPIV